MLQKYFSYQFSCNWFATLFLSSLSYWQVVNWLEGPGSEQLRTQWGIGDSIRASQALQQKHEEIESQHSVRFPIPFSSSKIILSTLWAMYCDCGFCIMHDSVGYRGMYLSSFKNSVWSLYVLVILFCSIEKYWFLSMFLLGFITSQQFLNIHVE